MSRRVVAADLFCGGGGTSTGLAQAVERAGYDLDLVAINHDETAVETHAANHPEAAHYCESLNNLDPSRLIQGGKLDLLVASPECTHFSSARGGKPCDQQSRAGAWHVLHWATRLDVSEIIIENVPAFASWGPLGRDGKPIKSKKGATYRAYLTALRSLGYRVQDRQIVCADHGDATTRKRLFIRATKGRAVTWPAQTHAADPAKLAGDMLASSVERWRPASEVLDYSLPSGSIFDRKRPLSDKTLARIAEGLRRYSGIEGAADFLLPQGGGGVARHVSKPLPTVHTDGAIAHVQPFIVPRFGERPGQTPRTHDVENPLPTVTGTNQHHLVQPFLVKYYGTAVGQSVDRPLDTVTAKSRFGLVEGVDGSKGLPLADGRLLDIRYRMLDPKELAGAMSFPEGYDFRGTKEQVVRQIGNAVPIRTARALCSDALRRAVA